MDLKQRLLEIRQTFESGNTPQAIIDTLNAHVERLVANGVAGNAIQVGSSAPVDLPVWSGAGPESLAELMGPGSLVMTWFRGNW